MDVNVGVSPVALMGLLFCFVFWVISLAAFLKRESIRSLAIAQRVRKLVQESIQLEVYMKGLPVNDERAAVFQRIQEIKAELADIEGYPQKNSFIPAYTPNIEPENVVSLTSYKRRA
ncbi:hypothetical protein NQU96_14580 [Pseudoalteromonas elyakovii]|jgi:hypothetical protein|uniref:hypothetical protein n=1 Tax=Pseudoalteromonas TaxID=53246 RepID=UPI001109A17B|nr:MULTISPECIES: hypothetical protein [Pseudoalteromonas]MDC3190964.1 hypothetical protein [Pseudoalteromonas elyakovii]MCO7208886.1 hypothetical protein [Pseudoalteromonas sp. CnMc7-37]MDI4654699.1 hypothetical protein [Pseudoalteromonas shioyasakiensis]NRA81720.1 hypothetical protein [Pseudoalteromonas sp.]NUJ41121.1 hypothetical protein [Pseudoalteromonas sp. 0303]|tara:strand:+ start:327 stop:677 length:351 start_codon:yes stop_codon:yes gene_type:complete